MRFSKHEATKQQCFIYPFAIFKIHNMLEREMAMEECYLLQAMPILLLAMLFVWLTSCTCGQAASTPCTCCRFKKRLHGDSFQTDTGIRRWLCVIKLSLQGESRIVDAVVNGLEAGTPDNMGPKWDYDGDSELRGECSILNFLVSIYYFCIVTVAIPLWLPLLKPRSNFIIPCLMNLKPPYNLVCISICWA